MSTVCDVTWMSANVMHLTKWTVALVQVFFPQPLAQVAHGGTQPGHSLDWSMFLLENPILMYMTTFPD